MPDTHSGASCVIGMT
ncbi:MAG: hypothetical protein ACTIOL_02525, partial [Enterococcus sp.]